MKYVDHLVLPVPSLEVARKRMSVLGFTVAPDGHHPFGSANACIFFQNGTYLEPLAIGQRDICQREADKGNRFLRRDRLYRQRNGDSGFSLIALTTDDAAADHESCQNLGYDCGEMVSFRRDVQQPDGSNRQIAVNLFITTDENTPDIALFSCQWVSEKVFDKGYKVHANGALGVTAIALADNNGGASDEYLETVVGQVDFVDCAEGSEFGKELELANGAMRLLTRTGFENAYSLDTANLVPGLHALAFDVRVADIADVKPLLQTNGIKSTKIGPRLVVPPAPGQGYTLAFTQQDG